MSLIGENLIRRVREKAAAEPDRVYQSPLPFEDDDSCRYVHDGAPSCIIGHALWNAGLINSAFEWNQYNTDSVSALTGPLSLDLDKDELTWLADVQWLQDRDTPWGEAVAKADEKLKTGKI